MASISVIGNDLERFQNDISEFQSALNAFKTAYEGVGESLRALNGMWEGPGKAAFMNSFEQDAELTREMIGHLDNIHEMYAEAHRAYSNCESQVSDLIASMNVGEV